MTALIILLILAGIVWAATRTRRASAPLGATPLVDRVAFLERRVVELQHAIDQLRGGAAPEPEPLPEPEPAPVRATTPPPPPPPRRPSVPAPEPRPARAPSFDWGRTISAADLMGAKALAFAGGVVTLLGVVFFFVLAVNRGWIGPELRVACGGIASALVFGAGLWLERRYERTYSALAAVGAGIAGAYATLLAAVSLYDLISKPVALAAAGAIASVGVAVSLLWSAEIVAGFGLIGAMLVPATLVFQGGLQEIGTAFVAIVFAGAALVAVRERWWNLLQAAAIVSVPQALAQIAQADTTHAGIVALALVFWLLYLAAGLAFQLRVGPALASAPASFLTGGALFGGISAAILYDGTHEGVALLIVASVYLVLATALFRRAREAALLVGLLGLAAVAVGVAQVLSGSAVTYAWASEAAILAWLTHRIRDSRFQLPALAYLAAATVHAVAFEASPNHFFTVVRHPAIGAPAALAVAAAAVALALARRSWEGPALGGVLRVLEPLLQWLKQHERSVDAALYSLAAALTAYAASLGILEVAHFQTGHVVVTAAWALAALAAVVAGRREAFFGLAVTVAKVVAFDALTLSHTRYGISFAIVGAATLLAGLVSARAELTGESAGAVVASMPLVLAGALVLIPDDVAGIDGNGLVLVAAGALYTAIAAATFRRRDLASLLGALGLVVAGYGEAILLGGVWLVLAYTATAAALGALTVLTEERRLQAAALVYLVVASALTLGVELPPSHLVMAQAHPGHGLASLVLLVAAVVVFAWDMRYRVQAAWVAGALAIYGASIAILEAAQRLSPEGVHTDFQRGQTAVSALWGTLALVSLYVGLKQRRGLLRGGGFILFAVSLGKIFLFDLPSLSSAQRALSFLAVGAVLLLGGFFYQRLSAQYDERIA